MSPEEGKTLPLITSMPVVKPEVLETIRGERQQGTGNYFLMLGANLARENPQQRKAYEDALRAEPPKTPDATSAAVLLVLRALYLQARDDGFRLPEIPREINPSPALMRLWPQSDRTEFGVISVAYEDLLRKNPVIGEILQDIEEGAPDELLRIMTETQAKRGAVYAYYGIMSLI